MAVARPSVTPAALSAAVPGDRGLGLLMVNRVCCLSLFVAAQACRAGGRHEAMRYFWKSCHTLLRALLREVKNGVEKAPAPTGSSGIQQQRPTRLHHS